MVALLGLPGRLLPCQLPRDAAGLPLSQNLPPLSSGALDAPGRAGSFWAGVQQTVKVETDLGSFSLLGGGRPHRTRSSATRRRGQGRGPRDALCGQPLLRQLGPGRAGMAGAAGAGLGCPHVECQGPRNPAKCCLAAGSCRATGGWLEAGQRSGALRMVLSITAQVLTSFLKILAKELIIVRHSAPRCLSRSGAAHTWARPIRHPRISQMWPRLSWQCSKCKYM